MACRIQDFFPFVKPLFQIFRFFSLSGFTGKNRRDSQRLGRNSENLAPSPGRENTLT